MTLIQTTLSAGVHGSMSACPRIKNSGGNGPVRDVLHTDRMRLEPPYQLRRPLLLDGGGRDHHTLEPHARREGLLDQPKALGDREGASLTCAAPL